MAAREYYYARPCMAWHVPEILDTATTSATFSEFRLICSERRMSEWFWRHGFELALSGPWAGASPLRMGIIWKTIGLLQPWDDPMRAPFGTTNPGLQMREMN